MFMTLGCRSRKGLGIGKANGSQDSYSDLQHLDSYNHRMTMYGNLCEIKQEAKQPLILQHLQHFLGIVDALHERFYFLLLPK